MLYTINNKEIKGGPSQRICGLDLIRVLAIFFVIGLHFFDWNTPYRSTVFSGMSLFIQGTLNAIFLVAVPLFLMLTGYLNINKTPTKKYYKGMVRVLLAYLLFSIITIMFRTYYLGEVLSFSQWILKVFNYSAIPYAWYIEMWIGLALLTPFLNYLWRAIPTMRYKMLFLAILIVLSALPNTFNTYGYYMFPGYFSVSLYPLMYYFIGVFIREYQPTIRVDLGCCILLLNSIVNPLLNVCLYKGSMPIISIFGRGPGEIFSVIIAVAIFLMLYRRDISINPIKKWVTHCSMVSLEMYLCCWMFDQLYYPWFKERFYESQAQFLPWFLVIVPLVFFSSYLVAAMYNWVAARVRR